MYLKLEPRSMQNLFDKFNMQQELGTNMGLVYSLELNSTNSIDKVSIQI